MKLKIIAIVFNFISIILCTIYTVTCLVGEQPTSSDRSYQFQPMTRVLVNYVTLV